MLNISLEKISISELTREWKKFSPKKSADSVETSAFLLKKLPEKYLNIHSDDSLQQMRGKGKVFHEDEARENDLLVLIYFLL